MALLAAFLTMLALLAVTGGRANRLAVTRWGGRAGLGVDGGDEGDGGVRPGIDPGSEVGQLEFAEGRAELGRFSIRIYEPVSRRSLRADFKLEGMTDCEEKDEFQQFLARNYRFFREQVTIAIRNTPPSDLADPEHHVLRKRIVARVNRAFNRDFLKDADFSNFTLYESVGQTGYVPVGANDEDDPL